MCASVACDTDISHKPSNAKYCSRTCKMAQWHVENRATPEGRESERARNTARYAQERERRKAGAVDYYWRNRESCVEYSRAWRKENPHRRRRQTEVRSERMRSNPGFVPFGAAEWERLKNLHRGRCAYCGSSDPLVMDHVIPLSRGGRHAIANILPACFICNAHKGSLLLAKWKRRPTYPRR